MVNKSNSFTNNGDKMPPAPPREATQAAPAEKTSKREHKLGEIVAMLAARKWLLGLIGLLALAVLVGDGFLVYRLKTAKQESRHEQVMDKARRTIPLDEKIQILQHYIHTASTPRFIADARRLLKKTMERMVQNELSDAETRADALIRSGNRQAALSIFDKLANKYRSTPYSGKILQKKQAFIKQIDTNAYEALVQQTGTMGPERVVLFHEFIKSHPHNPKREEIENQIAALEGNYYTYTKQRLLENEQLNKWQDNLRLIQAFFDIYPYAKQTDALNAYQHFCQQKIEAAGALADLKKKAEALADDYKGIILLYSNYLQANPSTQAKEAIEKEIKTYQRLSEQKRISTERAKMKTLIQATGTRFKVNNNGTVSDTQTGLTWCLLDSSVQLNHCQDYKSAKAFVKALDTGGHKDWRLPTVAELTALYQGHPAFPSPNPTWYWTSLTHKRYDGRWIDEVEVLSTGGGPSHPQTAWKASFECGAVRAVREGGK